LGLNAENHQLNGFGHHATKKPSSSLSSNDVQFDNLILQSKENKLDKRQTFSSSAVPTSNASTKLLDKNAAQFTLELKANLNEHQLRESFSKMLNKDDYKDETVTEPTADALEDEKLQPQPSENSFCQNNSDIEQINFKKQKKTSNKRSSSSVRHLNHNIDHHVSNSNESESTTSILSDLKSSPQRPPTVHATSTKTETYLIDRYKYAVRHIRQGLSVEEACNKYRISKGALLKCLSGGTAPRGKKTRLNESEENIIVEWLIKHKDLKYNEAIHLVFEQVEKIFQEAKRPNPFNNGKPSMDWWYDFLSRHPQIMASKPEWLRRGKVNDQYIKDVQSGKLRCTKFRRALLSAIQYIRSQSAGATDADFSSPLNGAAAFFPMGTSGGNKRTKSFNDSTSPSSSSASSSPMQPLSEDFFLPNKNAEVAAAFCCKKPNRGCSNTERPFVNRRAGSGSKKAPIESSQASSSSPPAFINSMSQFVHIAPAVIKVSTNSLLASCLAFHNNTPRTTVTTVAPETASSFQAANSLSSLSSSSSQPNANFEQQSNNAQQKTLAAHLFSPSPSPSLTFLNDEALSVAAAQNHSSSSPSVGGGGGEFISSEDNLFGQASGADDMFSHVHSTTQTSSNDLDDDLNDDNFNNICQILFKSNNLMSLPSVSSSVSSSFQHAPAPAIAGHNQTTTVGFNCNTQPVSQEYNSNAWTAQYNNTFCLNDGQQKFFQEKLETEEKEEEEAEKEQEQDNDEEDNFENDDDDHDDDDDDDDDEYDGQTHITTLHDEN
jgi:hypothetical protein